MAEAGKVNFVNEIDHKLQVLADPEHTYRIFHNLFRNAVQAMAESEKKILKVTAEIMDGKVCVRITDTGPGVPKRVQETLFKSFTSAARKGGTGLGLTISRELARAQGGNLQLESTGDTGTVFVVSLPGFNGFMVLLRRRRLKQI